MNTFVLKVDVLSHGLCFFVSSEDVNIVRPKQLKAKDRQYSLESMLPSIDVVPQKQVVLGRIDPVFELEYFE